MNVGNDMVVTIDYTLLDDAGQLIDSSRGGRPFSYLHGLGQIVPGLEKALTGKAVGDKLSVTLPPSEGYGDRDPQLIQTVGREQFGDLGGVEIGAQFQASGPNGNIVVTVVSIDGDQITLDGNHALAGRTLCFDVQVVDVRVATANEKTHGHAHGPDDDHGH